MITPLHQDAGFLADVAAARGEFSPTRLFIWWLGQSGFLVAYDGHFLLLDPYLSDALTRKYAATTQPHIRMTERVVDPAMLGSVSVITSSHRHTDHFDAETLLPLFAAAPAAKLVLPAANVAFAEERLGAAAHHRLLPLAEGGRATVGPFTFESLPAAHEALAPEFCGFVVSAGPFRIYHSGDTILFPGMAARLRPFAVDLALLPINGRAPARRVAGNLDGAEAAELAHAIGARCVVPCHYEMFTFNTAPPALFSLTCAQLGQPCVILRAGERLSLEASR